MKGARPADRSEFDHERDWKLFEAMLSDLEGRAERRCAPTSSFWDELAECDELHSTGDLR